MGSWHGGVLQTIHDRQGALFRRNRGQAGLGVGSRRLESGTKSNPQGAVAKRGTFPSLPAEGAVRFADANCRTVRGYILVAIRRSTEIRDAAKEPGIWATAPLDRIAA